MGKSYTMGGQRRTVNTACGMLIKGSPREVSGRFNIHKKRCDLCARATLPEYNGVTGMMNGWNGICGSKLNNGVTSMVTDDSVPLFVNLQSSEHSVANAASTIRELMSNPYYNCVLCSAKVEGYGNNPYPLSEEGHCCDKCNTNVIMARIKMMNANTVKSEEKKRECENCGHNINILTDAYYYDDDTGFYVCGKCDKQM